MLCLTSTLSLVVYFSLAGAGWLQTAPTGLGGHIELRTVLKSIFHKHQNKWIQINPIKVPLRIHFKTNITAPDFYEPAKIDGLKWDFLQQVLIHVVVVGQKRCTIGESIILIQLRTFFINNHIIQSAKVCIIPFTKAPNAN